MIKSNWKNLSFSSKLRFFLGFLLLAASLVFLYLKIVPGGHVTYSRSWPRGVASGQGFITDFKPGERMDISDPELLRMIGDPLYFSLFTPRSFDQARVTVVYRDGLASTTPIFEVGVLKNKLTGSYELRPLENKALDELHSSWAVLTGKGSEGEPLILQIGSEYRTSAEFLSDLERGELRGCEEGITACLAVYNYPLIADYHLQATETISPTVIEQPLRGAHNFLVYLLPGEREFAFDFVDLNLDRAADPISVSASRGPEMVVTRELADENFEPDSGRSEAKTLNVPLAVETAGVYKFEIKASDDVVISSLSSPSDKLVFINKIWPVSGTGGFRAYTDSTYLQVKTFNPASLGEITFGGQTFAVDEIYKQFNFSGSGGEISLAQDDMVLETGGVFALTPEALFNPNFRRIDRFFSPSGSSRYVIADYQAPRRNGEFKEASAELVLADAHREEGRYTFLLSVPGLGADTPGSYLEIKEIRVELNGRTLWQKIRSWISI